VTAPKTESEHPQEDFVGGSKNFSGYYNIMTNGIFIKFHNNKMAYASILYF
jgi:hypothetical protein